MLRMRKHDFNIKNPKKEEEERKTLHAALHKS